MLANSRQVQPRACLLGVKNGECAKHPLNRGYLTTIYTLKLIYTCFAVKSGRNRFVTVQESIPSRAGTKTGASLGGEAKLGNPSGARRSSDSLGKRVGK